MQRYFLISYSEHCLIRDNGLRVVETIELSPNLKFKFSLPLFMISVIKIHAITRLFCGSQRY